jgi:hypothetical protein
MEDYKIFRNPRISRLSTTVLSVTRHQLLSKNGPLNSKKVELNKGNAQKKQAKTIIGVRVIRTVPGYGDNLLSSLWEV